MNIRIHYLYHIGVIAVIATYHLSVINCARRGHPAKIAPILPKGPSLYIGRAEPRNDVKNMTDNFFNMMI